VNTVNAMINGEEASLRSGSTIAELVEARCDSKRGIAVARNGEVVPRSSWMSETVKDGDSIELLTAVAGG
jgi:sulfur carrier protein